MTGVARRAAGIPAFEVMDVLREACLREEGAGPLNPTVCHLEVGQPSKGPPPSAIRAARDALDRSLDGSLDDGRRRDPLGYTDALGLATLRHRIARWYDERHGLTVDPARIAVTSGASAGFVLTFLACFDPGDRVAVCEPGYPCYRNIAEVLGLDVVGVPVGPTTRYQPTPELLDAASADGDLAGLVVASPSNPTGAMLTPDEMTRLTDWCRSNDTRLVSDEIYHGISSGHDAPTTLGRLDEAIIVQSTSKYLRMPGWRLGWLVLPPELVRPIDRVAQNLYLAPPTLAQHAALGAFDDVDDLDAEVARYARNRDTLLRGLRTGGVTDTAPAEGAFYVWADFRSFLNRDIVDSRELCRRWLDEIAVAATPGTDFDPVNGHAFVRFSVAGSEEEIGVASERLGSWLLSA